ncbi:hypothetical protein HMPREF3293_00540 [Christensenella minuta]|uniref:Uncharacterized protein n=1 Tax=Christensenella minuta TaxID=626937 RepID=A0A136Q742_9FIRM|nr:hypothetical protein HMPREF3293_00540 [Christensenella minuta]
MPNKSNAVINTKHVFSYGFFHAFSFLHFQYCKHIRTCQDGRLVSQARAALFLVR